MEILVKSQINNIIYDFGGVLCSWEPEKIIPVAFPHRDAEKLAKDLFYGEEWNALDQGLVGEEEIILLLSKKVGLSIDQIRKLILDLEATVFEIKPVVAQLKSFKSKGVGLYMLSNMSLNDFNRRKGEFDFFNLFDGLVISAHVKLMKPDKKIYEYLLSQYSLKPEECVFIDDRPANVAAAQEVGIKGILFETAEKCVERLNKCVL